MSSYGSSVKAIRKASTHLTEEPFLSAIINLCQPYLKKMEHHETLSLINELQTLREESRQIACFIRELKRDYSILEEKIELSSADVLHLLGISKASLARWRESNSIPYRYVSSNHVVYPFKGLYLSVKTGRATFKGFRRLEALQRLNAYKEGVLKGYMGESQTLFEEL